MAVVGGHLERQLPVHAQRGPHARQQVEVVVDPLEGRVGEHEVEVLAEPVGDVALAKESPGTSANAVCARASIAGDESISDRLLGLHLLVEDLGQVAGPAAQIDDTPTGDGMAQHEEIVERLLAFRAEPLVLVGAPPVDRSHGHRPHV